MQRNRELNDNIPIDVNSFDVELVYDKDNDWWIYNNNGTSHVVELHPDTYSVSQMQDWTSEGKWKYNDVYHKSVKGHVIINPWPGLTGDTSVYAGQESTPEEGYTLSKYFLHDMIDKAKLALSHVVDSLQVADVMPLFRDSSLPHRVLINRDPFETDFSIWYAVVDLIQLVGSFGLKGFARTGRLLQSTKRARELGIHTRPHKARTAKDLADAHLAVRFGVIPTVVDAGELISMVKGWVLTYDRVKAILTKRFRKHEHVSLTDRDPQFRDWEETVMFNPGYGAASEMTMRVVVKQKVTWHGLALYGFTCPYFQGWLARLKQIIDSFGILDPAALWDVVPFSFIVDWFFTTQSWLHSLKPTLFPASAIIYDYLETIRHDVSVSYYLTWFGPSDPIDLGQPMAKPPTAHTFNNVFCGSEKYTTYVRRRFLPEVRLESSFGRGPSIKKSFVRCNRVAVSASLIAQRVPR